MERDSVGNRSSIMKTPDSSECVGRGSLKAIDMEELRKLQTSQGFLKIISPKSSKRHREEA